MDWQKIKDERPKAWGEMLKWNDSLWLDGNTLREFNDSIDEYSHFNPRDLFDFFDEKGIGITVSVLMGNQYDYTITLDAGINRHYSKEGAQDERDTCEEFAFTKAFEILEQQLNREGERGR